MTTLFDFGLEAAQPDEQRIYGVAPAVVLNNIDLISEGRIQVSLPWMPGFMPWARIATMMAGMARGSFFIPQVGDEVLVAFNQGDVREPYIIGALWSTIDRPPALLQTDPVNKRMIRTPLGQELEFDDLLQTVTLKNTTLMKVALDATSATVSSPLASITLDIKGSVTITAVKELTLQSNVVNINAGKINLTSTVATSINGGPKCDVTALQISLN